MTIRYDLSTSLQPYPLPVPEDEPVTDDFDELGAVLVRKNLSPHAAVSSGIAGQFHLSAADAMWTPTNGIHAAHEAIARWQGPRGIIRLQPDDEALSAYDDTAEDIGLLNGFRLPMETLLAQDKRKTLVFSSPNGISGRIATLQEVIRLARHFRLVVIDERLAPFSMRRLTPLVLEWENIVFVQRFPFIMPGQTADFGWIVHPGAMRDDIGSQVEPVHLSTQQQAQRYGSLNTYQAERQITRAKSQLYREMRKLSILTVPYPSWSNSLLARLERGDREEVMQHLAEHGIAVYAPPHDNLVNHFRITATSTEAIRAIRDALVEINREI